MADSMLAAAALIIFFVWGWQAAVCIIFSAFVLSGVFASLARELSDAPIWEERHLFTTTDVKRMKDVESRSKCKVRNAMKIKNRKMALIDNFVFPVFRANRQRKLRVAFR